MKYLLLFFSLIVAVRADNSAYSTNLYNTLSDQTVNVRVRVFSVAAFDPLPDVNGTPDYSDSFSLSAHGSQSIGWSLSVPKTIGFIQTQSASPVLSGNSYVGTSIEGASWVTRYTVFVGNETLSDTVLNLNFPTTRIETPDSEKTLWRVEGDTLGAKQFREGIDKLVWGQKQYAPSTSGSAMTKAQFQTTYTDQIAHLQLTAATSVPSSDDMFAQGTSARADAEASITQNVPNIPAVSVAGSSSVFIIESRYLGTINLDPASNAGISAFCNWTKTLVGWGLILVFAWWAWNEFKSVVVVLPNMQQAKGNPVVGGTGAQATALIAAGLMTLVFLAVPAAYWALNSVEIVTMPSSPFGGGGSAVDAGLYLFGKVFPYDMAVGLVAAAFVIRKGSTVMVWGVAAAIRYIVPILAVGFFLAAADADAYEVRMMNLSSGNLMLAFNDLDSSYLGTFSLGPGQTLERKFDNQPVMTLARLQFSNAGIQSSSDASGMPIVLPLSATGACEVRVRYDISTAYAVSVTAISCDALLPDEKGIFYYGFTTGCVLLLAAYAWRMFRGVGGVE